MWYLIGLILTAVIIGPLSYALGEARGYYVGLDEAGYELDNDGQIVKKADF